MIFTAVMHNITLEFSQIQCKQFDILANYTVAEWFTLNLFLIYKEVSKAWRFSLKKKRWVFNMKLAFCQHTF